MSVSYIPLSVKQRLWGKSAGRCQYDGCNQPLWYDTTTKEEFNSSYIAHIVADKPDGPRGDAVRSEELKQDIRNLMLMCDVHHRKIDKVDVEGHPEALLLEMKKKHEDKMELLTSLTDDKQSHVILYDANIGQQQAKVSMPQAVEAMLPDHYPAERDGIQLGFTNSAFKDHETFYWAMERENLRRMFHDRVQPRLQSAVNHFSVFAFAPMPLLIELGRLISDIRASEVYQLHREPADWVWQTNPDGFTYKIIPPDHFSETIALNLSLSATIDNSRIRDVLGNDVSIWTITIDTPYNDFLKSKEQLSQFRQEFRILLDMIKSNHGQKNNIHLFPTVPVSIAVEIGRCWMPKADLPLKIYDQNKNTNGFAYIYDIE